MRTSEERFKMKKVHQGKPRKFMTPEMLEMRRAKLEETKKRKEAARRAYLLKFDPCPFCGLRNMSYQDNGLKTDWIRCDNCNATGPISDGEDDATHNWNRRTK